MKFIIQAREQRHRIYIQLKNERFLSFTFYNELQRTWVGINSGSLSELWLPSSWVVYALEDGETSGKIV